MTAMIAQLLGLTRARLGGGFPLACVTTDLAVIAREVVEEFPGQAVRLEVDHDLVGTWDPGRLAEMLSNITGNALDHATPGTEVAVAVRREGDEVVIAISNQGEPIPADLMPVIFEPFRGGRPSLSERAATSDWACSSPTRSRSIMAGR